MSCRMIGSWTNLERRAVPWTASLLILLLIWAMPVHALSPKELIRLQKAGTGPEVIEALIQEKSIETGALNVDELLALKKAGLSQETLCLVIRAGSFLRHREPVVYGRGARPVRLATVSDLLVLKTAGLDEKTLRAVILSGSEQTEAARRKEALEWLGQMGLRVDMREPPP